jgi:hypothetical protein
MDGVASYPVIWKAHGELPIAGKLQIGATSLVLEGKTRGAAQRLELAYSEVLGLGRSDERLGRLPALRIEGNGFGTLLVAALMGAALNSEILDQLQTRMATLPLDGASAPPINARKLHTPAPDA